MPVAVIVHPAEKTEAELEAAGFKKIEAWTKDMSSTDDGVRECAKLGVGQFFVADYWGRCPLE